MGYLKTSPVKQAYKDVCNNEKSASEFSVKQMPPVGSKVKHDASVDLKEGEVKYSGKK